MRLPRLILNPAVSGWVRLLQRERQENARLRRELREWQNKCLIIKNVTPLFQSPVHVEHVPQPPVGLTAKRMYLAQQQASNEPPSAEEILAAAERAASR